MLGLKIITEKRYNELVMNEAPPEFYSCQIPNLCEIDGVITQVGCILCSPADKLAWLRAMTGDFSLVVSDEELHQGELDGKSFFRFF